MEPTEHKRKVEELYLVQIFVPKSIEWMTMFEFHISTFAQRTFDELSERMNKVGVSTRLVNQVTISEVHTTVYQEKIAND